MVAWICDSSNQGALDPAWDRVCHFRRDRPLEYSGNVSDIGTPRALPVFAREDMGAVLKAGRPP